LSKAKQSLVDKVMKGLEKNLAELSKKKEYREIFHRLLKEALQDATGAVTVRCRAEDRRLAEEYMAKAGKQATVQEIPLALGGVEVVWGGDRFIRKNTLESRLQKVYPELLKETNRLLFGEKAP
jgi:vacuolar-type H+-ATPase subunit E/Vma4